jgi:hypothetical protein
MNRARRRGKINDSIYMDDCGFESWLSFRPLICVREKGGLSLLVTCSA